MSPPDTPKPDWWRDNERIRQAMDLPTYEPPQFEDGVYEHTVVPELESQYDCTIRFIGINTDYLDEWEVRVNDEHVLDIGRHRDSKGNTIYEMTAAEFRKKIRAVVETD